MWTEHSTSTVIAVGDLIFNLNIFITYIHQLTQSMGLFSKGAMGALAPAIF